MIYMSNKVETVRGGGHTIASGRETTGNKAVNAYLVELQRCEAPSVFGKRDEPSAALQSTVALLREQRRRAAVATNAGGSSELERCAAPPAFLRK